MMAPPLLAAVLLSAVNPDPGPPAKDCARFEAHYRALLQHQAELDAAAERKPGDQVSPVAERVEARTESGQVAGELQGAVAHACRRANGSQYECVMTANVYEDLADCALAGLPVLARGERRDLPISEPPPTREERAEADRTFLREYVRNGNIDLEALGTGSAAQEVAPEPPAAASEGR
jgi:hypothetical protein